MQPGKYSFRDIEFKQAGVYVLRLGSLFEGVTPQEHVLNVLANKAERLVAKVVSLPFSLTASSQALSQSLTHKAVSYNDSTANYPLLDPLPPIHLIQVDNLGNTGK